MTSLTDRLSQITGAAFAALELSPALGTVAVSNRPDLSQFQCNGAMAAAKQARRPPREIAQAVAERLKADPIFADVSLAGPGFLNLTVTDGWLANHVDALRSDPRLGVPDLGHGATVVLDYGGPNIAKPMHVGHLRASIIGDSLRRLFGFAGYRTIGDVHLGDWGLPMGMLISELAIRQPDWPYFDPAATSFPADPPVNMDDLERLYPEAAAACREDAARLEAARTATAELQAGRPGYRALWQHFFDVSVAGLKQDFSALGVSFDLWNGEACVHDLIAPMIDALRRDRVAEIDQGAEIVRVAEETDKSEIPPLILVKSDGAVMYGTTDLATIVDRVQRFDPALSLYVVDQRQHLHFEQVFRAARKAGLAGSGALEHIGFGTVNGPDGKPFKTRAGGVMRLGELIRMATEAAAERLAEAGLAAEMDAEERADVARQVGIAAVKFADLANHRMSNYVFDLDRFTRFEGRTGPYLQYAAVRIRSLLRKAAERGLEPGAVEPATEVDRDLMLLLGRLPDAVAAAVDKRAPNELADFAHQLSQEFNRFYANCHILSETDPGLRASRLALAALTHDQIVHLLDLLGIEVPERM
ncbi:MAG: arginine--tRNA ligase [Rhodospirillaceae bacterium]|nr:arginine--tRNA ligase [Rhodospirillaceae bacterium]